MNPRTVHLIRAAAICFAAALLSPSFSTSRAQAAPPVAGTWRWEFTMPDGSRVEPRLKLEQAGDTLTGSTRYPGAAEAAIRDARLDGDTLSFKVVRQRDGRTATTEYRGKVQGNTIAGTITSDWAGAPQSYPWDAKRSATAGGLSGTWEWQSSFGDRTFTTQLVLEEQGGQLTGKVSGRRGGRDSEIRNGRKEGDQVSFEVVRGFAGSESVSKYTGTLKGDEIIGKSESNFGGEIRSRDWHARRANP
jgi:hypothetical protein